MTQLKKMSDNIHAYNSKLFVQLTAGLGRSAIPAMILDNTFVAPSATTNRWDPSIQHRALTTEEIYELIKDFATCAMLAKIRKALQSCVSGTFRPAVRSVILDIQHRAPRPAQNMR